MTSESARSRSSRGKSPVDRATADAKDAVMEAAPKKAADTQPAGKKAVRTPKADTKPAGKSASLGKAFYEAMFRTSPAPLSVWRVLRDSQGEPKDLLFVDATDAFTRASDLTDFVGRTMGEVVPDYRDQQIDLLAICARVIDTGVPEMHEGHDSRTDKWFRLRVRPSSLEDHLLAVLDDITSERAVTEALTRSKFLVDNLRDYPVWTDFEGRIIEISDATTRALEYTREELLTMKVFDISPTLTPDFWRERWRLLREVGASTIETVHHTKSGRQVPVEISTNLAEYEDTEYHCAFCRDITERKRLEESLGLTQFSVDQAPDLIYWLDSDGRIVFANQACSRLLGYSKNELCSLRVWDIDRSLTPDSWPEAWQRVKVGGPHTHEEIFVGKDDAQHPVEISSNHLEYGGREYGVTVARDITDRKALEDSLRITQLSVENAPDMIHWLDCGRLLYANRASCEFLGYSLDEMRQMHMWDISPSLTPELFRQMWKQSGSRDIFLGEETLRSKAGVDFKVEIAATHVSYQGRTVGIGFVRDLTERNEAIQSLRERDEQLRQAQKMEAIGRLAGGIAHDFNNVLTTIIGYSDLVLSSPELADSPVLEDIGEIKAAAERAGALTRRVLAFSRRQALQPTVSSLNEVVTDTSRLLSRTLGADVKLETSLDPESWDVEVDEDQFAQVLLNLAVNARDAMPEGGILAISTSNVYLDADFCKKRPGIKAGPYARMTVSDTGVGMDEDTASRIFEPFYTTKPEGEGTGLGLSTVYGLVTQSGGHVEVTSKPGEGTVFTLYLPRAGASTDQTGAASAPLETTASEPTILVVDEDATFASVTKRMLERQGYRVISTTDHNQVQSVLHDQDTDVKALLIGLAPDGPSKGDRVADQVSVSQPDLPLLFMSNESRDTMVESGRVRKEAAFLEKPFTAAELVAQVRTCLGDDLAGQTKPTHSNQPGATT